MPNLHCESCGQHVVAKINADRDAYCPDCGYCPAAAARHASHRNWTQETQDAAGGNDTSPVSGRMMDGERKDGQMTKASVCECGRKVAPGLADTEAVGPNGVVTLDGRTCRVCLRTMGFAPAGVPFTADTIAPTMSAAEWQDERPFSPAQQGRIDDRTRAWEALRRASEGQEGR